MKFLNQADATQIDVDLFTEYKYSVDQLMELAGLSCAHAIAKCYQPNIGKILVCCGPGNNGGDGLVCARHLALLGFQCDIYYPKQTDKELYRNLLWQCNAFTESLNVIDTCPTVDDVNNTKRYGLIVDALFGFSFKPPVRKNFLSIMNVLSKSQVPIARYVHYTRI